MLDRTEAAIRSDVERLCDPAGRDLGTQRNRDAAEYVLQRLSGAGLATDSLEFEVPEWRYGRASVRGDSIDIEIHPGPFSPTLTGEGTLVVVRTADEIGAIGEPGAVVLLCGDIAATQFTPRGYPFYANPEHTEIVDALEAARPLAVLSATGKDPMTGAMSPFPLIEEVGFAAPTAYMTDEQGVDLARLKGQRIAITIDSEVRPSTAVQPIGRRVGARDGRIIVSAHFDSKPDTPGAADNAAGVAVMLAVADLLGGVEIGHTLEFVPFNGEDHVLAPGELTWLDANPDLADVRLFINIDAAGLLGVPSAYSLYEVDDATAALVARIAENNPHVTEGPQWPASDHMIFAMRGVPSIAVTSHDFARGARELFHTPADAPDVLDYELLAQTAQFVADVIVGL
ncbi:MAG: M28 family peptidase [Coriobacteriia bacterium]|nr:M28 family peptidase [Coriobacteriia bacterium]